MSGGTPVGGGYMRQRRSQGYASSGDDLEDDATSRAPLSMPWIPRPRTWIEVMENVLWLASAAFIVYFGDWNSNLIHLLLRDDRIKRTALYLGFISIPVNLAIILCMNLFTWDLKKADENWEVLTPTAAPVVTLLGLISFSLFSFALWPIWSFLTLPLLFTLFMAFMVISPYLPIRRFRPQDDILRAD